MSIEEINQIDELKFKKFSHNRLDQNRIGQQRAAVTGAGFLSGILSAIPFPILILNDYSQIIYVNQAFFRYLSIDFSKDVNGLKPGEALECEKALMSDEGCGTTDFCRACGAAKAIMASHNGEKGLQECIITNIKGDTLNLQVWTEQFMVGNETFYFFIVTDISHEKRRRSL
jgi:PAS domain-containing protein